MNLRIVEYVLFYIFVMNLVPSLRAVSHGEGRERILK